MKARKKTSVRAKDIADMLVKAALEGMKGLDQQEQDKRITAFCDAAAVQLRQTRRTASGSGRAASGRMAARGRS